MAQASIDRFYVIMNGIDGIGIGPQVNELTRREVERINHLLNKRFGKRLLDVRTHVP